MARTHVEPTESVKNANIRVLAEASSRCENAEAATSVLKDWLEYSSFHGVIDISRPHYGKIWKCLWLIVMTGFFAMTAYTVVKSAEEFIENPKMQAYKVDRRPEHQFPDVLICTNQRFNLTKLKNMGASEQLINGILTTPSTNLASDGIIGFLEDYANQNEIDQSELARQYAEFLRKNNNPSWDDVLRKAGIDCESLVQHCSWSPYCCAPERVTPVLDMTYGLCYRFATGQIFMDGSQRRSQNYPGPGAGVRMLVRGHFDCGAIKSSVIRGVVFDVAYPNASMSYSYFQIPSGTAATVHLSMQRTERINLYGRKETCVNREDTKNTTIGALKATTNGCYMVVWSMVYSQYCNCHPMPGLVNETGMPAAPTCHPFRKCNASEEVVIEETLKLQEKYCLPECDRYEYKTTITYGKFDHELYNKIWKQENKNGTQSKALDEDTILLNIYHPVMEYVNVKETETYTFITLISNIGGAAGLWLGASLMSFFQMIFYLAKWISLKRSFNGHRQN